MNNLTRRILLVVIGLPLLFSAILLLDMFEYIGFNIIVILFSGLGAMECANIIKTKLYSIPKFSAFLTGITLPLAAYISQFQAVPFILPILFLFIILSLILAREVLNKNEEEISNSIHRTAAHGMIMLYPGVFAASMIYITSLANEKLSIVLFLILVFSNDTFSYIFGMLFGGKKRNLFAVSPNKSLAGFFGGLFGVLLSSFVFSFIFPGFFPDKIFSPIAVSVTVFIFANAGDLVESALKRSAKIKDSGSIIPGRGGVLDSIDSILFSAPFYVFIFKFLYYINQ